MKGNWRPFNQPEYKKPWHIIQLIRQIGRDIKWSHQRIWKGYCDNDLLSIDYWFIKIMPKMLKEFKETRHGSPMRIDYNPLEDSLDEKECNQDIHGEWDKKLDRMIFLLGEMDEDSCSRQNPYKDTYSKMCQKLNKPMGKHADESCTHRRPGLKEHSKYRELEENYHAEEIRLNQYRLDCKQEFFELFSAHFYELWD